MSAFKNNLQKDDRVFDTVSKRQGKVLFTPSTTSQRRTAIVFDGCHSPRYMDVMQLRLIVDGRNPEDVPPVDGTPPVEAPPPERPVSAIDALKAELERNRTEMQNLERRFGELKKVNEKLERAIAVLS